MAWVHAAGRRARLSRLVVALVAAAVALALAGCGDDSEDSAGAAADKAGAKAGASESAGSTEQRSVTMAFPVPLGLFWSGFIVAQERFYPELGLDVEFVSVDGSAGVAQQIATGNAFGGVVADREIYAAASKGGDVVSIAENGHGPVANVGVPSDSPIQSLEELEGKAIGVPSASDGSIAIVKELMSQAGVDEGSYELPAVGAGGPAVASALKSERIAAYAHGISDIAPLKAKGGITLRSLVPPKYSELPSDGVVVQASALEDPADRETAVKLARGYLAGWKFLEENREEAKEIICEAVPRECLDDDLVDATLDVVATHYAQPDDGTAGEHDYEKLELLIDMTLGGEQPVELEQVYTNDLIPEINEGL